MLSRIASQINQYKSKWNSMKPVQRKFWIWFFVIKATITLIILVLLVIFVMRFKQVFWV